MRRSTPSRATVSSRRSTAVRAGRSSRAGAIVAGGHDHAAGHREAPTPRHPHGPGGESVHRHHEAVEPGRVVEETLGRGTRALLAGLREARLEPGPVVPRVRGAVLVQVALVEARGEQCAARAGSVLCRLSAEDTLM